MLEMKEYIITLHNFDDLENFYDDMESPGGNLYIPDRCVEVAERRLISRNTHYWLTSDESIVISNDPRVLAVCLHPRYTNIQIIPSTVRSSNYWNKERLVNTSSTNYTDHKNWGLLRCENGEQTTNWGDNTVVDTLSISRPTNGFFNQADTFTINETGKNVDIVIVDGLIDPSHPEYAKNLDGTGGSRVVQFNWFSLRPQVTGQAPGVYDYRVSDSVTSMGINGNNNHGAHVAGTAAGNTQGWATDANIYNIYIYGTINSNVMSQGGQVLVYDYIRAWHNSKSINPETGRRNPTITNNSYSFIDSVGPNGFADFTNITYRGTSIPGPYTQQSVNDLYGAPGTPDSTFATSLPYFDADIQDAINDGIIVVAAAGNENRKIDIIGGIDYNNSFISNYQPGITKYYHRGGTPNASPGVITVGAIDALSIDYQASYSNNGPRVDIYAPGTAINSSIDVRSGFTSLFSFSNISTGTLVNGVVSGRQNITSVVDNRYISLVSTQGWQQFGDDRFFVMNVTKATSGSLAWDTGGYNTINRTRGGIGSFWIPNTVNGTVAFGLRVYPGNPNTARNAISFTDLDYAFYLQSDGTYRFTQNGNIAGTPTAYSTTTLFEIYYTDDEIKYAVDKTVVRTISGLNPNIEFMVDSSFYTPGASVGFGYIYKTITDPRSKNYFLSKIQGTSMASPQVTGVLACVLQTYPNFTSTDCLNWLTTYCKTNQITEAPNVNWSRRYDLRGASNRYLYYYKERPITGETYPKKNFLPRPTSGVVYPRPRIRRTAN